MGRPARFRTEDLVTAAIGLAAEGGPAAVTMAALARATGAPSGSLYHRFSGRPALLAAVWTHAVTDFQAGCRRTLAADPPSAAAEATARHVLSWSRARPDSARVLLHRPADFDEAHWPEPDRELLRTANAEVGTLLARLARELREPEETAEAALERVRLAVVDLPLALVRRHLLQGHGVPAEAEDLAADAARRLLTPRTT
ncbi:TetR/AcrR family transcriptional regulator [Nocardiopsis aegyptia]|uniref:AcrR family transcriptional regulator n=1 Tax=Nocardiopsis aegyptia TaxID=220378 RepID=A0A7Z0J935_9ACTN|nr:TetR/AcrR family transcriptional regulator [Nocardiopsis aegyptia]NYJ33064.1 AcrR family transcriptional regulator [Nocardiopsis aegyptia]